MKINLFNITKEHVLLIKAVAITFILFHNFFHILNTIGENEMQFDQESIYRFFSFLKEKPWSFFEATCTYFGHYGVQLFIVVSGYGLTKQFLSKKPVGYKQYIIPKIIKLYSLLLFGMFSCFVLFIDCPGIYLKTCGLSLTMLRNFSYDYLFYGIGPWWYFSLALQLYLLFPLLYRFIDKYKALGFYLSLLISYILIYGLLPATEKLNIPLFGNSVGHLPEFLLGIGLARLKEMKLSAGVLVLAVGVFTLSNFYEFLFPLSFLSAAIILLVVLYYIITHLPAKITSLLLFVGKVSMFIFIVNGPLRKLSNFVFIKIMSLDIFIVSIIHFVLVLIISYLMYLIYNKLMSYFHYFKTTAR